MGLCRESIGSNGRELVKSTLCHAEGHVSHGHSYLYSVWQEWEGGT